MRIIVALALSAALGALASGQASAPAEDKAPEPARVYIKGEGNVDVRTIGSTFGGWGWAGGWRSGSGSAWSLGASETTVSKHNQTMELAKQFSEKCPAVVLTLDATSGDYAVALNHEAFHGIIHKNNQILVANRRGDVVFAKDTRSVAGAVKDACARVAADWKEHGRLPAPVKLAEPLSQAPPQPAPAPAAAPQPDAAPAGTVRGTTIGSFQEPKPDVAEAARKNREQKKAQQEAQEKDKR
jgi:hypothetical protein